MNETVVITGAFSYTGKYATRILIDRGHKVRTLTSHPNRPDPLRSSVEIFPYNFEHPAELRRSLAGASTLINTYWVRFPRGNATFESAVENSRVLIEAARAVGIERIVHVSIANPSLHSPLAYYRGKAQVEDIVRASGLAYAILRPTVIFGPEDILINNIAWFVRRFPVFGIPGDGKYAIRPIYVGDMARLLVDAVESSGNQIVNAVGSETFGFEELVRVIAQEIGQKVRLVHLPLSVAYVATRLTGWLVRDLVLTWEEYKGLMSNLLAPEGPAAGQTLLTDWLTKNRQKIGTTYASEVERHYTSSPDQSFNKETAS